MLDDKYFEELLEQFRADPGLGLAGGDVHEMKGGTYRPRSINRERIVPGAIQRFRQKCFEDINGFLPLPFGGEDTMAGVMARMHGWRVRSCPQLPVLHQRKTAGGSASMIATRFREGRMDSAMGNHPAYELAKSAQRVTEDPYVIGSLARLAGYVWSALRGDNRTVPSDVVRFMRDEQLLQLRHLLHRTPQGDVQ